MNSDKIRIAITPSIVESCSSSVSTPYGADIRHLNIKININSFKEVVTPYLSFIVPCVYHPRKNKGKRYKSIDGILNALRRIPYEVNLMQNIFDKQISIQIEVG